MKKVGLIVEYNPFHNGHLYHIKKARELFPDALFLIVMSGNFIQRGGMSILSKDIKAKIALNHSVDIVIDLPFVYANEAADIFAMHSVEILNYFEVSDIVFGSEVNDIDLLFEVANVQYNNESYNISVQKYLAKGLNYPTACSKALLEHMGKEVKLPNDILGLSYIKAVIKNNYKINLHTIKRTNEFHSLEISEISSATSIRNAIINKSEYSIAVPEDVFEFLNAKNLVFTEDFYELIKYKLISTPLYLLREIHLVDEGIENRLYSCAIKCDNLNLFTDCVKSKRYTNARINRIIMNVLINYTKGEKLQVQDCTYYRVTGFNSRGQKYLKEMKNQVEFATNIKIIDNIISDIEYRASNIYKIRNKDYKENFTVKKIK